MKATAKQGFTIIELLVVIVVIGILALISIVTYNGIQERARDTANTALASQFRKQVQIKTSQGVKFKGEVAYKSDAVVVEKLGLAELSAKIAFGCPSNDLTKMYINQYYEDDGIITGVWSFTKKLWVITTFKDSTGITTKEVSSPDSDLCTAA